ncbi:hypothetical protein [Micrococcus porci]|uniref:hypothetical protein n=1 Tax=Micrococcus porci TaxID=2856555 RepID=UPI003CEAC218
MPPRRGTRHASHTPAARILPLELVGVDVDPFGLTRAGLEGSRRIDRTQGGLSWNTPLDSGGVLISERITLEFELSLIRA